MSSTHSPVPRPGGKGCSVAGSHQGNGAMSEWITGPPGAQFDLHGQSVLEAVKNTERFLQAQARARPGAVVRLITGRGSSGGGAPIRTRVRTLLRRLRRRGLVRAYELEDRGLLVAGGVTVFRWELRPRRFDRLGAQASRPSGDRPLSVVHRCRPRHPESAVTRLTGRPWRCCPPAGKRIIPPTAHYSITGPQPGATPNAIQTVFSRRAAHRSGPSMGFRWRCPWRRPERHGRLTPDRRWPARHGAIPGSWSRRVGSPRLHLQARSAGLLPQPKPSGGIGLGVTQRGGSGRGEERG
jgi:hypothetical protein